MKSFSLTKAGLMTLFLSLAFVIAWESFWRMQGFELSYNDDEALWTYHRQRIYDSTASAPVIIGSSRVKFGIDLPTWQRTTGAAPVQLAQVGTSPRPILKDLANDINFKGTVLVGVTEFLFFSPSGGFTEKSAMSSLVFYPKWSIAQKVSFRINQVLESKLLFLDEEKFALRFLLERLRIPDRPGVFAMPPFPLKFTVNHFDRQTLIADEFVADTTLQREQQQIWWHLLTTAPKMPMNDTIMNGIFEDVKTSVQKITARGGRVVFVRMPSTDKFRELEKMVFPREQYWDRLLRETGATGVHFEDYPELAYYPCPEWSHLAPEDAKTYTRKLIRILEQKTGWPVIAEKPAAAPDFTSQHLSTSFSSK